MPVPHGLGGSGIRTPHEPQRTKRCVVERLCRQTSNPQNGISRPNVMHPSADHELQWLLALPPLRGPQRFALTYSTLGGVGLTASLRPATHRSTSEPSPFRLRPLALLSCAHPRPRVAPDRCHSPVGEHRVREAHR